VGNSEGANGAMSHKRLSYDHFRHTGDGKTYQDQGEMPNFGELVVNQSK
jgi:hypothetical protein